MKANYFLPLLSLLILILSFFLPPLFQGRLPIPADTIVGLYHPYRDLYAAAYPNGIPFKNYLITDPVRQQYPWKFLSLEEVKKLDLPTWNPYTMAGTPLLANFQSGVFYPLNILLMLMPFPLGWGVYIILQPILAGVFLYLYLRNLKCSPLASLLGGLTFAYAGFSVAWLEWGNILHTGLWLPVALLSIDKIFTRQQGMSNVKYQMSNIQSLLRTSLIWYCVFLLSFVCSFFAGHLQTFFYLSLVSIAYFFMRWAELGRQKKVFLLFALCALLFAILTLPQWLPTLQFITESARNVDQADWTKPGWFLPWQHLIQFIVPDFFGNPTTLNYFGVWNYGEFIGYVGIFPLLLGLLAIGRKRDKTTWFYAGVIIIALVFALPTFLAKLPYQGGVPFLSTAQPTRLIFLIDFSLSILAGIGFDHLLKERRKALYVVSILVGVFAVLWGIVLFSPSVLHLAENAAVSKRNLQLPTLLLFGIAAILFLFLKVKNKRLELILIIALLMLTVADISRFAAKFTPFTTQAYLFPSTKTIEFLKEHLGNYRYMTTDSRLMPPNFSLMYHLQTVDGYDPLYLRRYGEFIAAMERGKPDISAPLGFNRILTPHSYQSPLIDFLGVKYILSLSDLTDPSLRKVFQEGETRVYENTEVYPRAFFIAEKLHITEDDTQSIITALYAHENDLQTFAVSEGGEGGDGMISHYASGSAEILTYTPSKVRIHVSTEGNGFLVLTDSYYPTWSAALYQDNEYIQFLPIFRTNYNFRGVVVPAGEHIVEFTNSLF